MHTLLDAFGLSLLYAACASLILLDDARAASPSSPPTPATPKEEQKRRVRTSPNLTSASYTLRDQTEAARRHPREMSVGERKGRFRMQSERPAR
jgi:hypothetical protein